MFEDWGVISRKRCMIRSWCQQMTYIGNHPSFMIYRLARSPLTQRDWKVKARFGLVYGRPTLPKLSPYYCALHFPIVPCRGRHHKKSWGTVKKIYAGICAPTASGATDRRGPFLANMMMMQRICKHGDIRNTGQGNILGSTWPCRGL